MVLFLGEGNYDIHKNKVVLVYLSSLNKQGKMLGIDTIDDVELGKLLKGMEISHEGVGNGLTTESGGESIVIGLT